MTPQDVPFYDLFVTASSVYFIPWYLLAAQVWRESKFDPEAMGPKGEVGLAQFTWTTWQRWGWGDRTDPGAATRAQARYLLYLCGRMDQRGHLGYRWPLAAYLLGPWHSDLGGSWEDVPEIARKYVEDILAKAEEFKALEEGKGGDDE